MSALFVIEAVLVLGVALLCALFGGVLGVIALNLVMRDQESAFERRAAAGVGGFLFFAAAVYALATRL